MNDPIDIDAHATWPEATRQWAEKQAVLLAGSTEFTQDLSISLEQEDEFRQTFGDRRVLAYHCSRLLPHEVVAIRHNGLRLLDRQLVADRVADAIAHDALPPAARQQAETGNVFIGDNAGGREGKICFVLGCSSFDEAPTGCDPLLRYWGGEAIRGGPSDVPALAGIGSASIVVAKLNLTRPHNDPYSWPALPKLFVGSLLGLDDCHSEVHYPDPVSAGDVLDIWRSGQPAYDRFAHLPR